MKDIKAVSKGKKSTKSLTNNNTSKGTVSIVSHT